MKTSFIHSTKGNRFLSLIFLISFIVPFPAFAHPTGNTTEHNHAGLPWPPEPRGITDVVIHTDVAQEVGINRLASDSMNHLELQAKNNPNANRALGKKFKRITQIDKVDKKSGKIISDVVFFSYDKNATVNIEFANDTIQTVKSTPAVEYQPEITDEEATEAEALARKYFLDHGITQISNLEAFSILAYKPTGVGFFDTRVIYVSFHDHDDAPPQFMAWVDLSQQRIIKARKEP